MLGRIEPWRSLRSDVQGASIFDYTGLQCDFAMRLTRSAVLHRSVGVILGVLGLFDQGHVFAQETFSRAYTFDGVGGVTEVPGSGGLLLCQTERYGLGYIDGFSFFQLEPTGFLNSVHYYSTGPLSNVMQGGAIPMVRSDGSFSFLFGNHAAGPLKWSIRLFNTTSDGVMNWNRKIEFVAADQSLNFYDQTFFEAPDGGYVILATRWDMVASQPSHASPAVVKLDAYGNVIWNKNYNVTEPCVQRKFCTVDPSGETLVGFNSHHLCSAETYSSYITKISNDGGTLWSKQITGLHGGMADCVKQNDGYLIVANDTNDFRFIKVDNSGDLIWSRSYNLSYGRFWASQRVDATGTFDDGAVISSGFSAGATDSHILLFKIDAAGSVVWRNYFYDSSTEQSGDIKEMADNSLIQLSRVYSSGHGNQYYIRKIASDGYSPCIWDVGPTLVEEVLDVELTDVSLNEFDTLMLSYPVYVNDTTSWENLQWTSVCYLGVEETETRGRISINPNPFAETAVIELDGDIQNAELLVYNSLGVQTLRQNLTSPRSIISRVGIANGIYLYRLLSHGKVLGSGKIILE